MIRNCAVEFSTVQQGPDICSFLIRRPPRGVLTNLDYVVMGTLSTVILYEGVAQQFWESLLAAGALVIFSVLRLLWRMGTVEEEKLTVMRELGIQLTRRNWGGREQSVFIDRRRIKAVVINEAFRYFNVITYLAFIVEGEDDLVTAYNVSGLSLSISITSFLLTLSSTSSPV